MKVSELVNSGFGTFLFLSNKIGMLNKNNVYDSSL